MSKKDNVKAREQLRVVKADTPNGKLTKAFIDNSKFDAADRIFRIFTEEIRKHNHKLDPVQEIAVALNLKESYMHQTYSGTVVCHPEDEYDETVGEDLAVKKVMKNHHASFIKKLRAWQVSILTKVYEVCPETFESATNEVITKYNKMQSDNKDRR